MTWSRRCSSSREHRLPSMEPGLLLWLLHTAGCLRQWSDVSEEPLPVSSEFNDAAPAALVAAGVYSFTHTNSFVHVHTYRFFFPLRPCQCWCRRGRQMGYFPASLSLLLLRERDERALLLFPAVMSPLMGSAAVGWSCSVVAVLLQLKRTRLSFRLHSAIYLPLQARKCSSVHRS